MKNNKKFTDEQLVELKDLWESKLVQENLSKKQRRSLALNLNEIKGKQPTPTTPAQSDEKKAQEQAKNINMLRDYCSNLKFNPPLDDKVHEDVINAISNSIKAKSLTNKPSKEDKIKDIGTMSLYRVETTSEGECMYSSFIYSLFLVCEDTEYLAIPATIPQRKHENTGKI